MTTWSEVLPQYEAQYGPMPPLPPPAREDAEAGAEREAGAEDEGEDAEAKDKDEDEVINGRLDASALTHTSRLASAVGHLSSPMYPHSLLPTHPVPPPRIVPHRSRMAGPQGRV